MKTNSQKQLLMVDSSGSCVSLKLGTSAGLHYYDGQMLWVNPAATVTASAPRQPLTSLGTSTAPAAIPEKKTKAIPIIDPTSNEEIVIKTKEPEKKEEEEAPAPAPPLAQISQVPVVTTPSVPLATVANPQLSLAYVSSPVLSSPVQVNPIQTLFKLTQNVPVTTAAPQTRSVLDLFAKATAQSPQSILNASNIIQRGETKLPPNLEEDDRRKGRGKSNGRGNSRGAPSKTTNARGASGRGNAQQTRAKAKEGPPPDPLKYIEPNAKYTASLDGRFWCLSQWPTGERDESHSLTFGKHKLPVEENGVIRVVLYGGVNTYRVKLHLADETGPLGQNDPEGWTVCTCSPNATNIQLSEEAVKHGWKIYSPSGELPSIYPPSVETPTNNDAKAEE